MERRLTGLFLVALSLGTGACLVVDSDGLGGSGATSSDGGTTNQGGSTTDGGGGSTSNNMGGGGGTGGSASCTVADDCPTPLYECVENTCDGGVCGEQYSVVGFICSAGICDGAGYCVECVDDTDCVSSPNGSTCDVASGNCYDTTATGACADSFCAGAAADNTCFACLQSEGAAGGACNAEASACLATGAQSGCTSCSEFLAGTENGAFCAGSQAKFNDYFDCICSAAACLD